MKAIGAETLARRIRYPVLWGRSMSSDKGHSKRDFFSHSLNFIASHSLLSYFLLEKIFIWWNLLSDGENTLAPTTLVSSVCIYRSVHTNRRLGCCSSEACQVFLSKNSGCFCCICFAICGFLKKKKKTSEPVKRESEERGCLLTAVSKGKVN